MRYTLVLLISFMISEFVFGQENIRSCNYDDIAERHIEDGDNFHQTMRENEVFIQDFIKSQKEADNLKRGAAKYIIPLVLHVFHDEEDGKLTMEQIESGLKVLNDDIQGLNDDWNDIDPAFDGIKESLDIEFCLASIDPNGNPTTGVNYYQDPQGMLNQGELRVHAWDNYKYFNIYMPKYVWGSPSIFTAYAYFPSTTLVNQDMDGVFYSSIRWGYGQHSELEDGQDWASVITHEVGHWLNLQHTFSGSCNEGDNVDDTPPTLGGEIQTAGCYNNDFSCGVATNGSNYMDYNHDCKKMFTKGQVERMTAALHLPSRMNLWSEANLISTGCFQESTSTEEKENNTIVIYPNPSEGVYNIDGLIGASDLRIFSISGELLLKIQVKEESFQVDLTEYNNGIYLYRLDNNQINSQGILVKSN